MGNLLVPRSICRQFNNFNVERESRVGTRSKLVRVVSTLSRLPRSRAVDVGRRGVTENHKSTERASERERQIAASKSRVVPRTHSQCELYSQLVAARLGNAQQGSHRSDDHFYALTCCELRPAQGRDSSDDGGRLGRIFLVVHCRGRRRPQLIYRAREVCKMERTIDGARATVDIHPTKIATVTDGAIQIASAAFPRPQRQLRCGGAWRAGLVKSARETRHRLRSLVAPLVRVYSQKCKFMGKEVREISRFLLRRCACLPPPSERHAPSHFPKITQPQYRD